jgi:hypothetical protein
MVSRFGLFISVFLLFSDPLLLHGQCFNEKPLVWLSRDQGSAVQIDGFIGNYPLLDLSNKAVQSKISEIGDARSGSLFIVWEVPSGDSLACFGYFNFSDDEIRVGNHLLPMEIDIHRAGILKVDYSIGPKVKLMHKLYLHDSLKVAEVIFFSSRLSTKRSREIETYLALKYSVNISQNKDEDKRDYVSGDMDAYWSFKSDHAYKDRILGLGRLDALGFFQSVTWANDDELFLSVSGTKDPRGAMPNFSFPDSAMLVFAEKQPQEAPQFCGINGVFSGLWKIKSKHLGQNTIDTVYLTSTKGFPKKSAYFLTDGLKTIAVEMMQRDGSTVLEIPIGTFNSDSSDCYLMGVPNLDSCETILEINQSNCSDPIFGVGKVEIRCDESLVGSGLHVIEQKTGIQWDFVLESFRSEISGFSNGQYEFSIRMNDGSTFERALSFSNCSSVDGLAYSGKLNDSKDDSIQFSSGSEIEIQVYPNPVLRGTEITIEISGTQSGPVRLEVYDQNGKQINIKSWEEMKSRERILVNIHVSGIYNVVLTSGEKTEVRRVVVN